MLEKPLAHIENRVNVVINNQNSSVMHDSRVVEPSQPPKLPNPFSSNRSPRRHSPRKKKKSSRKRRKPSSNHSSPRRGSRQNSLASTVFADPRESLARIEVDQLRGEVERRLD